MSFKSFIFTVVLLFSFISCARFKEKTPSANDLYWSHLSLDLLGEKVPVLENLALKSPHLYRQIINDSKDENLVGFWGQSYNFDSEAKKKIIEDVILSKLHEQFKLHYTDVIVHAGVTHTYGYLFSLVQTPYGFKRKRWIEPTLNYAFSLKGNSLSPETTEGGLLSNITYFMGMIAFKNQSEKDKLNKLKNVSSEILNFKYDKLKVRLLEEEIIKNEVALYTIRTSFVALPLKRQNEESDYLLIYSIYDQKAKHENLITAFPIKDDAYKRITSSKFLGAGQNIQIRYNGYLSGFMGPKVVGNRKFH